MWILQELSIQGFPAYSFLLLLAAFWGLGLLLTRGEGDRGRERAADRKIVPLEIPERPDPQPAREDRKLAA